MNPALNVLIVTIFPPTHSGSFVPFSNWRFADGMGCLAAIKETQESGNKIDEEGKHQPVFNLESCCSNFIMNMKEQEELIADWHPEPLVPSNPDRNHPALNPLVIEGKVIIENLDLAIYIILLWFIFFFLYHSIYSISMKTAGW